MAKSPDSQESSHPNPKDEVEEIYNEDIQPGDIIEDPTFYRSFADMREEKDTKK